MGDMADFINQGSHWGTGDDWGDGFSYSRSSEPQNITCRYCQNHGFHWVETEKVGDSLTKRMNCILAQRERSKETHEL